MGIIRTGSVKIDDKEIRLKVFGREEKGKFVPYETYLNEMDLINVGLWKHKINWDEDSPKP